MTHKSLTFLLLFVASSSLHLFAFQPDSLGVSNASVNAKLEKDAGKSGIAEMPDSTKSVKHIEWFLGGKIAFNSYSDRYVSEYGASDYSETTNVFGISPKCGIFIDDKIMLSVGVWYNTKTENTPKFVSDIDPLKKYVPEDDGRANTNSLSFEPHFRYKVKTFKALDDKVALWAELRPSFSIDWITYKYLVNTVKELRYGIKLAPIVTFRLNEKVYIETSLDIMAISWQGSKVDQNVLITVFDEQVEVPVKYYTSNFGFSYGMNFRSIANAIISIGFIRKF